MNKAVADLTSRIVSDRTLKTKAAEAWAMLCRHRVSANSTNLAASNLITLTSIRYILTQACNAASAATNFSKINEIPAVVLSQGKGRFA